MVRWQRDRAGPGKAAGAAERRLPAYSLCGGRLLCREGGKSVAIGTQAPALPTSTCPAESDCPPKRPCYNCRMGEKTVAQKLGLKAGKKLLVTQQPEDVAALIGAFP